jgi:toxin ParE1/3/4
VNGAPVPHLLPKAVADLDEICAWLVDASQGDREIAHRFALAIDLALQSLSAHPRAGVPRRFRSSELDDVRLWSVPGFPNHLILYRCDSAQIVVVRIVHGARDLPAKPRGARRKG